MRWLLYGWPMPQENAPLWRDTAETPGGPEPPCAVIDFDELGRADAARAGGKGANLAGLTATELPVPPGFVVGTSAFADLGNATDLRERIATRLASADIDDALQLSRAAKEIRRMVEREPMPKRLEEAISDAYLRLADGVEDPAVAVRSSATAEDTAAASFAGMNETLLDVRGTASLLDAVRQCWSSLFNARSLLYRAAKRLPQAEMDIAVIVQRQIETTRAGVILTINPATGARDRLVIEAAFGSAQVTAGTVRPDRFFVDKETLAIERRQIRHRKTEAIPASAKGTIARPPHPARAADPVLSDAEVRRIAELGLCIEAHYGSPQDIEWAIDSARTVWILQARPLTGICEQ